MKKISLTLVVFFSIFNGCSPMKQDEVRPASQKTIAKKLDIPWQINSTQNEMWISERSGGLVSIGPNHKQTSYSPVFSSDLSDKGEGGFLGFVLDSNFKTNKKAYAYYTYEEKGRLLNRVVEMNFDTGNWVESKILIDHIPGGFTHNGGRLEWGPDKKLYITTGDSGDEDLSQNLDSLAGKILRINSDGTVPKDNPFYPSPVYTYGHRNPQGMTWDEKGIMFSAEHGSSNYDEINMIEPGKNYGWPVIRGSVTKDGMETPWVHSGNETWAPSGIQHHDGFIYVASLRGESVMKVSTSSKKQTLIVTNEGRIRDILIEGNEMFLVTNNTDGRGQPSKEDDRLLKVPLKK